MSKDYNNLVKSIIENIGEKENIAYISHCVTRLRFELKDRSRVKIDEINKVQGVLGSQFSSGQLQIIIGPHVKEVYQEVLNQTGFENDDIEDKQEIKHKYSIKEIGNNIITNLTGSITPVLPIIISASLVKVMLGIFGPTYLNWIKIDTGLHTILSFVGSTGFHFLPVFLGYTSAKQFKTNPLIGMFMGAVLIHPSFIAAVSDGATLELFGIQLMPVVYTNTVLPIIMTTFIMSCFERFLNKYIHKMFKFMLVPFLTILLTLPFALLIVGPIGSIVGEYLSEFFLWIHSVLGPFGIGIIAVAYLPLILTGMHHTINIAAMMTMMTVGHESVVLVAATAASMAVNGVILGFTAKAKTPENKSLGVSSAMIQMVGGIVEPALFGILLPHRNMFIAQVVGSFLGGTLMGFLGLTKWTLSGANLLIVAGFLGPDMGNFVKGIISSIVIVIFSFILSYALGFDEEVK